MTGLTIFKEISNINVENEPDEVKQIYHEIYDFIFSGVWTKSEKIKSMLPMINEDASLIAQKMGLTKTNVLASRSQSSDKLRKILGKNLHERLLSQDKKEYQNFRIRMQCAIAEVTNINEIISPEQLNNLCMCDSSKVFEISECENEIAFLASISIPSILHRLDNLDREKLDFILGVLSKPNHYKVEVGSRVKNETKFQVLGQILYLSQYKDLETEYQRLKEFARDDHNRLMKRIKELENGRHSV